MELMSGAAVHAPADVPGEQAGSHQSSRDQRNQPALAPKIRRRWRALEAPTRLYDAGEFGFGVACGTGEGLLALVCG